MEKVPKEPMEILCNSFLPTKNAHVLDLKNGNFLYAIGPFMSTNENVKYTTC